MRRYRQSPRTQESRWENLCRRSSVLVDLRVRHPHLLFLTVLRPIITCRVARTRIPIPLIPMSSIKTHHPSLHRRPIAVRPRRGRSHTCTRSPRIRHMGLRNMSDSRQVDMQLRSLPLKHSLSSRMFNIIHNHNHRHSNGNKHNIAPGSKRSPP
jgi:hypothetical protein